MNLIASPSTLFAMLLLMGCAATDSEKDSEDVYPALEPDSWAAGPYTPAHTTLELEDLSRGRSLVVELWFPGEDDPVAGAPAATFEEAGEARETLGQLLDSAPSGCPTLVTRATRDGAAHTGLGSRPFVVFSHCHNCGRYSSFSLAERLASHGVLVASADHGGALPFAEGAEGEPLDSGQLDTRAADVGYLIDAALEGSLFEESMGLVVDPEKIGVFGHSFGSVTAGRVAQDDGRIRAAAGLAAPMANPLFPSVSMDAMTTPLFLVLAEEDNSILELGNELLRMNVAAANPPVWQLSLADAGHWSVSDLCGLTEDFAAGCGSGERHSAERAGEVFDYIPVRQGIEVTQRYLTTFFLAYLGEDTEAMAWLEALPEEEGVSLTGRLE
jgi:predicted dienelactone hydrolase